MCVCVCLQKSWSDNAEQRRALTWLVATLLHGILSSRGFKGNGRRQGKIQLGCLTKWWEFTATPAVSSERAPPAAWENGRTASHSQRAEGQDWPVDVSSLRVPWLWAAGCSTHVEG